MSGGGRRVRGGGVNIQICIHTKLESKFFTSQDEWFHSS